MTTNRTALALAFAAALGLTTAACGDDDDMGTETRELSVSFTDLPTLGDGYVYEGWLIVGGQPISTGRFTETDSHFAELDASVDGAEAFVLTIEPAMGDDPAPSDVHIVAGDLDDNGRAALSIDHGAALGVDLASATGTFILETPSSMMTMDDYNQGIWWLDMSAGPGASLDLPELPAGWVYEGWVVGDDGPISTGTFTAADMADSDMGGDAAGPDGTPPFPGQDFIDPAMDLVGMMAVISVEPMPDDSPMPFVLKPLAGAITDAGAGANQSMDILLDAVPSGTATLQ